MSGLGGYRYDSEHRLMPSFREQSQMWFAVARAWEAKGDPEMAERCRQNARLIRDGKAPRHDT